MFVLHLVRGQGKKKKGREEKKGGVGRRKGDNKERRE